MSGRGKIDGPDLDEGPAQSRTLRGTELHALAINHQISVCRRQPMSEPRFCLPAQRSRLPRRDAFGRRRSRNGKAEAKAQQQGKTADATRSGATHIGFLPKLLILLWHTLRTFTEPRKHQAQSRSEMEFN